MSSRRALLNAGIISLIPSLIFLLGINLNSRNICNTLSNQSEINLASKQSLKISCNKLLYKGHLSYFYLTLLSSTLLNWPIVRLLDDRQWYREWMKDDSNA